MRVEIAGQQHGLKEENASGPDRRAASKPWQQIARDNRLDLKKQERT